MIVQEKSMTMRINKESIENDETGEMITLSPMKLRIMRTKVSLNPPRFQVSKLHAELILNPY